MTNLAKAMIFFTTFILLFFLSGSALAESEKLAYSIRFDDYEIGSVEDWLLVKGFEFKEDARRRNVIELEVNDGSLTIEAKRRAFGIMLNEAVNVADFTFVEIDWGINKFPEGTSYEQGIRNEALMVMFFMGDERQPSGSWFIPDSPYFVGLFLCNGDDRIDYPYVGSYYKTSGRYVCGGRPAVGEMVTTRFNLFEAYKSYFDKEGDDDPAISGLALAIDSQKAKNGGKTSAYIREIRVYH